MSRHLSIIAAALFAFFFAACGAEDPPCSCTGEVRPECAEECAPEGDSPENVGKAISALSLSPSAFYSIAYASGYGPSTAAYCNDPGASTWCECNVVYSDNASRCNEPTATTVWEFPAPACVVSAATLTYTASASYTGHTVDLRRILRPVATPPMGIAGSCVSASVASWWRSGPEAWTSPGAKGDGTDRTAAGVSRVIVATAQHSEVFDVTALVQGCVSGPCVLAQFADAHVYVHPGAVLDIACGSPATCGDGVVEGAEGCDDGAAVAGDGCSAACALESGWTCSGAPSACETDCGDGIPAGLEECDDGGNVSGDGCSAACVAEVCSCE